MERGGGELFRAPCHDHSCGAKTRDGVTQGGHQSGLHGTIRVQAKGGRGKKKREPSFLLKGQKKNRGDDTYHSGNAS